MGRAKPKIAFEHAQNVQIHIIPHIRKISPDICSPLMLSIVWIRWFWQRTAKGLDPTAHPNSLILARMPERIVSLGAVQIIAMNIRECIQTNTWKDKLTHKDKKISNA